MSASGNSWWTRRGTLVRGPYAKAQISRYVLLGRIRVTDELRFGDGKWKPLSDYPQLIPEVMRLAPTEDNQRSLQMARLRADERRPGDRRERIRGVPVRVRERRSGRERRQPESAEMLRRRALQQRVSPVTRIGRLLYRHPLLLALLIATGLLFRYAPG